MSTIPQGRARRIDYYRTRISQWIQHAHQIGLDPAVLAELEQKVTEARVARIQQRQAMNAARSATTRFNMAVTDMAELGSCVVKQIRARAAFEGNEVYVLAWVSPPAKPAPIGEPGEPKSFAVSICATGALKLRWKCRHPRGSEGVLYHLHRRVGAHGPREYIGYSGKKAFVDGTLPPGTAEVTYFIQAVRSTRTGPTANFTVTIGGGEWAYRTIQTRQAA